MQSRNLLDHFLGMGLSCEVDGITPLQALSDQLQGKPVSPLVAQMIRHAEELRSEGGK